MRGSLVLLAPVESLNERIPGIVGSCRSHYMRGSLVFLAPAESLYERIPGIVGSCRVIK